MDRETLIALRERVVAATGPDRELDIQISRALGVEADWHGELDSLGYNHIRGFCALGMQPLTASIDAALALVERVLPGTMRAVGTMEDGPFCQLVVPDASGGYIGGDYRKHAITETLSILAALLSALIAKETARG
jgi:hypothetical protein